MASASIISSYASFMVSHGYLASASCAGYCSDIRIFVRWAARFRGGLRWSAATRDDFEEFAAWLVSSEYEYSTINRILTSLTSLYNYFVHERFLTKNVLYEVRRLRPSYHQRQALSADIVAKALAVDSLDDSTRCLISLLYESGLRIGEAMALTPADIDVDTKSCRVTGKGRSYRVAYFGESTAALLLARMRGLDDCARIFPLSRRQYNWDVYHALAPFAGGRKCSPHILRHTYATEALANGMPLDVLRMSLGHKQITTTMLYNHCDSARVAMSNNTFAPRV